MTEYFMPISELSKKMDLPAHTLRYWEKEFPQIIKPITGAGGRRFYRNETVDNFMALKTYLYADGFTIDGVKKLIQNSEFKIHDSFGTDGSVITKESDAGNKSVSRRHDLQSVIDLLQDAKKILNF